MSIRIILLLLLRIKMPKPPYWTAEKFFSEIKRRIRYDKSLNSTTVFHERPGFWQVGRRMFGSWGNSLEAFLKEYPEYKEKVLNLNIKPVSEKSIKVNKVKKNGQLKLPLN
jgi:hypothetical protein